MPAISSLGIGSGMDINSIVTQLVALERRPLQQMQTDATKLQTKVSSYGKMQSLFSALQDASNKLAGPTLWNEVTGKSADSAAVAVTASNGASTGAYSVSVQALASSQTVAGSAVFANTNDLAGAGTLAIDLGSWNAGLTAFSPKAGASTISITLDDSDTLTTLRDKINGAGAGVTASIVTDATGSRLAIRARNSGVENGFRIGVTDADGNATDATGLSRFGFNPPAGATQLQQTQAAANAQATINGIAINSASNSLSGVLAGVSLQLGKVTTTAVDITVNEDRETIGKAVTAFATAYSDVARYITEQTKFDAATKTGGPLQGDSAATGLQSQLRSILSAASGASTTFSHLSDLGLQLQRDGTLLVNQSKLDGALVNLSEVRKAFANADTLVPTNNGFAKRYALLTSAVLGSTGAITTRTEGLRKQITNNSDKQQRLNAHVDLYEKRLVAQYTAMDANLSKLNGLSAYVTQQLAALSANTNNR